MYRWKRDNSNSCNVLPCQSQIGIHILIQACDYRIADTYIGIVLESANTGESAVQHELS